MQRDPDHGKSNQIDSACTFKGSRKKGARLVWEITAKCNLDCYYCFRTDPRGTKTQSAVEARVLNSIDVSEFHSVLLTGGEPLLHPTAPKIVSRLSKKGIAVSIATNLSFDAQYLERLQPFENVSLSTSLDGWDRESHDSVRGLGSAAQIEANVRFLNAQSVSVSARTVPTSETIGRAREAVMFAQALGFRSITFSRMTDVPGTGSLDFSAAKGDMSPSDGQLDEFHNEIAAIRRDFPSLNVRTAGFASSNRTCSVAGSSLFFLDARGNLHPCTLVRSADAHASLMDMSLSSAVRQLSKGKLSRCSSTCPAFAG